MLEFYPTPLASTSALNHEGEGHAPSSASSTQFRQAVIDNDHPEQSATVKTESSVLETICAGCGRGISDRFLMRVSDRLYHEDCLVCAACGTLLQHSCFTRDLKMYCRPDYERIYGRKCARCMENIGLREYVIKSAGLVFHVECFACCMCGQNLPRGAQYFLRQGQPICRRDYEHDMFINSSQVQHRPELHRPNFLRIRLLVSTLIKFGLLIKALFGNVGKARASKRTWEEVTTYAIEKLFSEHFRSAPSSFHNGLYYDELMDENRPRDGRRGPKRPRTILTSAQRRQFKASFELSPKPCRKVREALAKDTGLSVRVVQVWFQNQRAKMKKLQRKAKTEPGSEKEPKEERRIESPHSDHSHYLNVLNMRDGESSSFPSATQPLNPNNPYSPEDTYAGNSGESFCSSDLSLDGTEAGYEIGDNESGAPDVHHGSSHFHGGSSHDSTSLSQSLHAAIHNPIDKLFMMQSSYFSGDHA